MLPNSPDWPGYVAPVSKHSGLFTPRGTWTMPALIPPLDETVGGVDTRVAPITWLTGWAPVGHMDMTGNRQVAAGPIQLNMQGATSGGASDFALQLAQAYGASAYSTPTSEQLLPAFISGV